MVGYSRLAGADEDHILARLRALRSDFIGMETMALPICAEATTPLAKDPVMAGNSA